MVRFVIISIYVVVLGLCVLPTSGQKLSDPWLRVITEDDYVIDVDRTSLILESKDIIQALFRTTYSDPVEIAAKSDKRYAVRLDSMQFRTKAGGYRIKESSFLDKSGKKVSDLKSASQEWKLTGSRTGGRLFRAASQLAPFGYWKVISYHYFSGEGPSPDDPEELRSLIGSTIALKLDHLFIGSSNCSDPTVESQTVTDSEVSKKFGTSLKSFGIESDRITAMRITCHSNDKYPPYILVILRSATRAAVLWDGVFLSIERPGNRFLP